MSEQNQKQDQYCTKAFEAMNHGDYEEAFNNFKQTESLPQHKKESYLRECLHAITDQYVYLIKERVAEGDPSGAVALKQEYTEKYGENPKINQINISATRRTEYKYEPKKTSHNLVITPDNGNSFRKTYLWILPGVILAVIILFITLRNIRTSSLDSHSEAKPVAQATTVAPSAHVKQPSIISPAIFNDSLRKVLRNNDITYNISDNITNFTYKGGKYKVEAKRINNSKSIQVDYLVELGRYKPDLRKPQEILDAINSFKYEYPLATLHYSETLYGDVAYYHGADYDDVWWYDIDCIVCQIISSPHNLDENIFISINSLIKLSYEFAEMFESYNMDKQH